MSDEIKNNENICSVTHIRRVDITENSESTGNGDDRYTDTEEKTAIDTARSVMQRALITCKNTGADKDNKT